MGMAWLAKNNDTFPVLSGPNQLQVTEMARTAATQSDFLNIGSIIVEVSFAHVNPEPTPLIQCSIPNLPDSHFSLWVDQYGAASAELRMGQSISKLTMSGHTSDTHSQLRITYSWNTLDRVIMLTIENPERGTLDQVECNTPLPMPMQITNALLTQSDAAYIAPNVTFIGASDQIEPVGFTPTIAGHSPIDTPQGPVMIENLKRGDLVTTVDNGPQPIRWICERKVPTMGLFRPLRLRAPYFGLTRDILVAPEQRIVFENTEVEYLFGEESVLVEARHLTNRVNVLLVPAKTNSIRLYQLLFDNHEVITVAGCQMESLFVGQIADNPEVLGSTLLKGLRPADIPRHPTLARPLLRSYEATTLQSLALH